MEQLDTRCAARVGNLINYDWAPAGLCHPERTQVLCSQSTSSTWAPQGNPTPGLCLLCPHIPTHWITVLTSFPSENNHTGAHILRGLKSLKLHVQTVSASQEVNVNRTKKAKMDKINEGSQLPKPSFKCTHLLEVFQTLRVDWMTFLGTPKLIQIRVTQSSRTVRTTRKIMQESKL